MNKVYIIGLGMIRFNKYPDSDVRAMAHEAVNLALDDAGLEKKDIGSAYFSNTFWGMFAGQQSIRGEVILRSMGIEAIPVTNVENACAGASTALHLAYTSVRAGMTDVALALGSEKITHENKAVSLGAYASCMDVGNFEAHMKMIEKVGKSFDLAIPEDQSPPGKDRSIFMDAYAMGARWHMSKYGSTQEQLAFICAKNHWHGSLNPLSQYQQDMTMEEVLADKAVAYPLTRAMCAPVGDGAAAAIVCSEAYLKRLTAARPILIRASVLGTGTDRDLDGEDIGERLGRQAYETAGLGPKDMDLAELHDATAYGELHQTEVMGFCPEGEGGIWAMTGATKLGGKQPVNTSGGLECRGHPIGASGLAQIYEIGLQLRGEAGNRQVKGARIGLAENGGGNIGVEEAAMCIHILEKGSLMARIFITGISGYIASLLARTLLDRDPEVRILGLDIRDPAFSHPRLEFVRRDIREPLTDFLKDREIDTIVHTAWVLAPDHDEARMADINVTGCLNILKAAKALSVSQVLYTSSTTAYGFYPDNEIPLTEDSPLRGNADFTYARNKRQMERVFKDFARDTPEICVTVLRPCYVAGPGLDNPLSDHLKKSFVPLIRRTAPFQYVHEDDLVRVMILSIEQRLSGIFNVAPEGTLEFDEMVRMLGNVPVRLPDGLVRFFNGLAWKLKLSAVTQFPNAALNLMRHPWIASSDKLVRTTGFEFQYDTREAFQSFARHHLERKRP